MWTKKLLLGRERFTHLNLLNFIRNDSTVRTHDWFLLSEEGFGGLVVSMVPEFAGSIPTEAVGFFPM
jgi:hypothetical protein